MERFQQIIKDLIKLFEESLPLEEKKLQAIQTDDVAGVEECMKQEQALTLKLRGLDQKREAAQKELGWEDKSFREIIGAAPEEKKQELSDLFDQLDKAMTIFQDTNQNAMTAMEVHLRDIQKVIRIKDPEGQYNQAGNSTASNRTMTSRRV